MSEWVRLCANEKRRHRQREKERGRGEGERERERLTNSLFYEGVE